MKIALFTIWHEGNYGAELQAYATIKVLTSMGAEVELVNYRLHEKAVPKTFRNRVSKLIDLISPANIKFCLFWKHYFPHSRRYFSLEELEKCPPSADMYIVGSDQVWNLDITKEKALSYFLPFGDNKVIRASLSSSFGVPFWKWSDSDDLFLQISQLLERFSFLSCREASGARILKEKFGQDASVLVDPSLLRPNFNELIGTPKIMPYLAYYELYECKEIKGFAINLSNILSLRFKPINEKVKIRTIVWNRTSPVSWIRGIAEASFVVTHSFHGVVLSLLYHRPFIVVFVGNQERSVRITELLGNLGLMNRFFTNIEDALSSQIWKVPINYDEVDAILNNYRAEARMYIESIMR